MKKKILGAVALVLAFVAVFAIDALWEDSHKPWESGDIKVNGAELVLPVSLAEFQEKTGLAVQESDQTIRYVELDAQGKKGNDLGASVQVYVEGDKVTGVIANNKTYGGWTDPSIDALVTFPCGVNTGMALGEIKDRYSTGLFNMYQRESKEEKSERVSSDTKLVYFINTFVSFSGDNYCVSVIESQAKDKSTDQLGTTMEVFYYVR